MRPTNAGFYGAGWTNNDVLMFSLHTDHPRLVLGNTLHFTGNACDQQVTKVIHSDGKPGHLSLATLTPAGEKFSPLFGDRLIAVLSKIGQGVGDIPADGGPSCRESSIRGVAKFRLPRPSKEIEIRPRHPSQRLTRRATHHTTMEVSMDWNSTAFLFGDSRGYHQHGTSSAFS